MMIIDSYIATNGLTIINVGTNTSGDDNYFHVKYLLAALHLHIYVRYSPSASLHSRVLDMRALEILLALEL